MKSIQEHIQYWINWWPGAYWVPGHLQPQWHEQLAYLKCLNVRADSRFVPSQWEMALFWNDVSHWLGASLESAPNVMLFTRGISVVIISCNLRNKLQSNLHKYIQKCSVKRMLVKMSAKWLNGWSESAWKVSESHEIQQWTNSLMLAFQSKTNQINQCWLLPET